MARELINLMNLNTDEDIQENLRLALMFKDEVDEATRAYMEILQMAIKDGGHTPEEVTQAIREALRAALLTGIRAYRGWIETEGINVKAIEENSGRDIPRDYFHDRVRWPL